MAIANVTVACITLTIPAKSRRWTKMAAMNRTVPSEEDHTLSKDDHMIAALQQHKVI